MSDQDLDPTQARARFGELTHVQTRTYREFDDPSGGIWRPKFNNGVLEAYRLHPVYRTGKATKWRRKT